MCGGIRYLVLGSECRVRERLCQYFFYHFKRKITLCYLLILNIPSFFSNLGRKYKIKQHYLWTHYPFHRLVWRMSGLSPFISLIRSVCISFLEENLPQFQDCLTPKSFKINLFLGRWLVLVPSWCLSFCCSLKIIFCVTVDLAPKIQYSVFDIMLIFLPTCLI